MADFEKGHHSPLNVTEKARYRIFAGLGWDPSTKTGFFHALFSLFQSKKPHHDLDLSCFMYGADDELVGSVSAHPGEHVDETGRIYHSGDNREGVGDGDDEQISVELKKLDEKIKHIVFVATIKSGHVFGEVAAPEIRIVDGYSHHSFLKTALLDEPEAAKSQIFAFAHVYRKDGGWMIHNISESLLEIDNIPLGERLKPYLSTV